MQSRLSVFLTEVRRRRVYRVAVAYVVVGSGVIGLGDAALPTWDQVQVQVVVVVLLGLPIALVLAWLYEVRPEEPRQTTEAVEDTAVPTRRHRISIVVLPFDNMSPDPGDAYFADGLTEETITRLSRLHSLRVISRNSAMALRGTRKDTRTIARDLDVQFVLEGSVRKSGDDLRITVQLIDAASDEHVWAETYDEVMESVFSVQETVARSVVETLGLTITAEESNGLHHRPIDNVPAYECYLRARQDILLWTPEGFAWARRHLHNGLTMVGENAALLYGMALVEQESVQAGLTIGDEAEESLKRVSDYATRILELEPDSPHGHSLLGIHHQWRGDYPEAVFHYGKALEADPASPDVLWWFSIVLWSFDSLEVAGTLAERFVRTDPLSPRSHDIAGIISFSAGQVEEGIEATARAYELEPENHQYRLHHVVLLVGARRFDEARALCEEVANESPDNVDHWHLAVFAAALRGDGQEVDRLVESSTYGDLDLDEHSCVQVAQAYHVVGERAKSLAWLERGMDRGQIGTSVLRAFFGELRGDPRFEAIMSEAEGRRAWFSDQLPVQVG
jgi:TolB-like protein/tetratricopeptide (TPR) repeat protein